MQTKVVEVKEVLNSEPVNNTLVVEPENDAVIIQNDRNETVSPSKSATDTSSKNKLNLTIDIPKDEETAPSNVQSATEQAPIEYDVKFEV